MLKEKVIIIGSSGHSKVIIDIFEKEGDFVILNSKAVVEHDCFLADFSSLAPNVAMGGNVKIGSFSAISISATIKQGLTIGKHSVVGAGAVVLKSINDNELAYGIPAKVIRKRAIGEKYL